MFSVFLTCMNNVMLFGGTLGPFQLCSLLQNPRFDVNGDGVLSWAEVHGSDVVDVNF